MMESESAVLEVSSGGADDSSVASLDSCSASSAPVFRDAETGNTELIMDPGCDIVVRVDEPLKQVSMMETYVTYRVRCRCARWESLASVRRRYNHFKALRQRLVARHPYLPIPPLPQTHTARQQLDRYATSFVCLRTVALNTFLTRIARHAILTHSEDLHTFLTAPSEADLERALRGAGSPAGPHAPPVEGPRVRHPEFAAAAEYMAALLAKLKGVERVAERIGKENEGMVFEIRRLKPVLDSWAARERGQLGRALQTAAAAAARAPPPAALSLEPLREYAAYADVVREKIAERDAMHASYAATNNTSDILHNRLECASEALRSELISWHRQKRADMKAFLLQMAERQIWTHQRSLAAWESALATFYPQQDAGDDSGAKSAVLTGDQLSAADIDLIKENGFRKSEETRQKVDEKVQNGVLDDTDDNTIVSEECIADIIKELEADDNGSKADESGVNSDLMDEIESENGESSSDLRSVENEFPKLIVNHGSVIE